MKDYIIVIFVALALVVGLLGGLAVTDTKIIEVEKLVAVEVPILISDPQLDYLYNQAFEDDALDALAESAAIDEINSRSFKKDLFELLSLNTSIDDYKDIKNIRILDSDIDSYGNSASFDLKVYYYLDGDDEETEKARFTVDFDFDELELDEEPEFDVTLTLDKVYN